MRKGGESSVPTEPCRDQAEGRSAPVGNQPVCQRPARRRRKGKSGEGTPAL